MDIMIDQGTPVPTLSLIGQFWERDDARRVLDAVTASCGPRPRRLVMNLERLTFIGSIGMGGLMKVFSQLAGRGCELLVYCPRGSVKEVLELARFSTIMKIIDSGEALRLALQRAPESPPAGGGRGADQA